MKNITFSADEWIIEEARETARRRKKTLNEEFRRWLLEYARCDDRGERARQAIKETRKVFKTHGPYSRDEMNAR